jgi:hypothetical protein
MLSSRNRVPDPAADRHPSHILLPSVPSALKQWSSDCGDEKGNSPMSYHLQARDVIPTTGPLGFHSIMRQGRL